MTTTATQSSEHPAATLTQLAEGYSRHANVALRQSLTAQQHLMDRLLEFGLNSDELTDAAKLVGVIAGHEFDAGIHQARATDMRVAAQDALDAEAGR